MAEQIKCRICGEMNDVSLDVCTNCRTPLKEKEKTNIPSGQVPTKKHTAELEPILPQWLREARDAARNPEPEEQSADFLPKHTETEKQPASPPDLLAGLHSQADSNDEEEVPDWLASITGASPKSKSNDEPIPDSRRVEIGGKDDFAQDDIFSNKDETSTNDSDVPPWLSGLQESQPEKDELSVWLKDTGQLKLINDLPNDAQVALRGDEETHESMNIETGSLGFDKMDDDFSNLFEQPSSQEPSFETSQPVAFSNQADDTPDWLKQMSADAEAKEEKIEAHTPNDAPEFNIDTPDWLSSLGQASNIETNINKQEDQVPLNADAPDWLNDLGSTSQQTSSIESNVFTESSVSESEAEFNLPSDMPDWLKDVSQPAPEEPQKDKTTPAWLKPKFDDAPAEMPAWLQSDENAFKEEKVETPQNDLLVDMPSWLKAAAPETSIYDAQDELKPIDELKFEDEAMPVSENLDWAKDLQPTNELPETQTEKIEADPFASMPAFSPSDETENIETLFTDMPDWLSEATPTSSTTPTPITNEDVLPSSNLPSWVEAMRPSDNVPQSSLYASDQTLESRGALAGLQGVLPAMAGFTPTSKPKAYSLKLNSDDEQQRHAAILEQILTAETAPVPLESFSTLRTSRALRWTLAFLIMAIILSTTLLKTNIFSLPVGVPNELNSAIQIVQSIPENATILVAVDYEASRAGEMEVAAAPLFDNLLLLKHPRLTFIATNETGSMLAERFMTGPLAGHNYQHGATYLNLGYLSGGQLGIRAFAQNPTITTPLDVNGEAAWSSVPLQGVTSLNQFTAMILITDNASAARVWVEQTESWRADLPFIVISSAQSTPMIQPYYQSGQVDGIVSGLYAGAIFEQQVNAGRPGTARQYWDAYSIGMLLAMSLTLGGGLWNLIAGLRERALRGEK